MTTKIKKRPPTASSGGRESRRRRRDVNRTPQHRPFGLDVKILFRRAVLVEVVGDGVGFIIRVGDAADVPETTGPARAVAVPARGPNGLKIGKETTLVEVRGTRVVLK